MQVMIRRGLAILCVTLLGDGGGLSAQTTPAANGPKPTEPAALAVDTAASRVYIRVGAEGIGGHSHGVEGRLASGSIRPGGPGELVFATPTFVADTPNARAYVGLGGSVSASDRQKTTENMLGSYVLDVRHYPQARFAISRAVPMDGQSPGVSGRYRLDGRFTLHNVARPLSILATLEPTNTPGALRMRGAFAIIQSQYGITPFSALGGLVRVADKLEIWGDLILRAQTP